MTPSPLSGAGDRCAFSQPAAAGAFRPLLFQVVKIPDTAAASKQSAADHIITALLTDMARKLGLLCERVATAHDPLGTLFSVFGIA